MHPIIFGNSAQPLFGVLHPAVGRPSDVGVVLLQPGIQEYERAHWVFRTLATALAARGRHVLRFDYRGTGDSAGEPGDATMEGCVEDARLACEELREVPGVRRVSLVGMRLGAAIAAMACARGGGKADGSFAEHLVLWEPVVRGAKYLKELEAFDSLMRLRMLMSLRAPANELGGFVFPWKVRASIGHVDLARLGPLAARRVLVFASAVDDEVARLEASLQRAGTPIAVHTTADEAAIVAGAATSIRMAKAGVQQEAVVPGLAISEIATHIELAFA
jgi:pimeloyl-ACP methyl ester carboxylesterase